VNSSTREKVEDIRILLINVCKIRIKRVLVFLTLCGT